MSTQTESVAKLRSDLKDAEKQLKALLEKRESYKSELAKIDDEERSLAKKLQDSKAKLRALVAASASSSAGPGSAGSGAAAGAKSAVQLGVLASVAQFSALADALPDGVVFASCPATAGAAADTQTISGPATEDPYTIADLAAARTVSTYPLVPGGAKRVCVSAPPSHKCTHTHTRALLCFTCFTQTNSKDRRSATSTLCRCSQSAC